MADTAVHLEIHLRVCVLDCVEIVGGSPVGLVLVETCNIRDRVVGCGDSTVHVVAPRRVVPLASPGPWYA